MLNVATIIVDGFSSDFSYASRAMVNKASVVSIIGVVCILTMIVWNTRTIPKVSPMVQRLHPGSHSYQQCHIHQHIYFLKVHKAASTTAYNIFARFGLVNNLNMLTLVGRPYGYPHRHFDNYLPPAPKRLIEGKYDIYCEHSIYDEDYLLPKLHNDTVNIAVVREPMSHFRSSFQFYDLARKMKLDGSDDPETEFLARPLIHSKKYSRAVEVTRNRVAMEFGYEGNRSEVENYLQYIDSRFLVLVFERLPESLIVMKRKLCWGMKDILHAQSRKQTYNTPRPNATLTALHKSWSPLDYVFYDYFSHRMEQLISEQDNDFQGEVTLFQQYLENANEFCDGVCARMGSLVKAGADDDSLLSVVNDTQYFAGSKWGRGFTVTGLDCLAMRYNPKVYRDAQKVRLFPEQCTSAGRAAKKIQLNKKYCDRSLPYGLPLFIIKKSIFVSACF